MTKGRTALEIAREVGLPVENFHPVGNGLHMEIMDGRTRQVWQVMDDVTQAAYDALEVEAPFVKIGVGSVAGHLSYFRRSPGAESDGPMARMEHAGFTWSQCAQPEGAPSFPFGPDGARQISVLKHHSIVFAAGSEVGYLRSPDAEYYVHVVDTGLPIEDLNLPAGWKHERVVSPSELTLHLPCPTTALFFANFESYQGPVPAPDANRS